MAVAYFSELGGVPIVRTFQIPKRASDLKYWWRAMRKAIPKMPEWDESFRSRADITVDTIIIDDSDGRWKLVVARKRQII